MESRRPIGLINIPRYNGRSCRDVLQSPLGANSALVVDKRGIRHPLCLHSTNDRPYAACIRWSQYKSESDALGKATRSRHLNWKTVNYSPERSAAELNATFALAFDLSVDTPSRVVALSRALDIPSLSSRRLGTSPTASAYGVLPSRLFLG